MEMEMDERNGGGKREMMERARQKIMDLMVPFLLWGFTQGILLHRV